MNALKIALFNIPDMKLNRKGLSRITERGRLHKGLILPGTTLISNSVGSIGQKQENASKFLIFYKPNKIALNINRHFLNITCQRVPSDTLYSRQLVSLHEPLLCEQLSSPHNIINCSSYFTTSTPSGS